jgi:hypothetical protein
MSLFNWFAKSKSPAPTARPANTELGMPYATVPFGGSARGKEHSMPSVNAYSKEHQAARHLRREQLYVVVREEMLKTGALTSAYKFKVLSLDARGISYLVMLELPVLNDGEAAHLTAFEQAISRQAKNQHGILVTAVYWRANEFILRQAHPAPRPTASMPLETKAPAPAPVPVPAPVPAMHTFEPLQQYEMQAFKRALAAGSRGAALADPGQITVPGKRKPQAPADFDQHAGLGDYLSPLGVSQYGTL